MTIWKISQFKNLYYCVCGFFHSLLQGLWGCANFSWKKVSSIMYENSSISSCINKSSTQILKTHIYPSLFCVVLNLNSWTLQVSIFETQKVRLQSHILGINPQPQKAQTLFTLCRVPLTHNNDKNQLSSSKYVIVVVHY